MPVRARGGYLAGNVADYCSPLRLCHNRVLRSNRALVGVQESHQWRMVVVLTRAFVPTTERLPSSLSRWMSKTRVRNRSPSSSVDLKSGHGDPLERLVPS